MMLTHLGYGFLLSFVAFVTPAMLNMTTVRTSIERGYRSGFLFGLGASTVNALQACVAFYFLRFLTDNPDIILWLKRIGVLVLFALAIFFYRKSKDVAAANENEKGIPPYMEGALLSSINMLAIPYYTASALALEASNKILAIGPNIYFMAIGVLLGGTTMFAIYAFSAETISERSEYITKNINLILSGLFIILGIVVLINLFW